MADAEINPRQLTRKGTPKWYLHLKAPKPLQHFNSNHPCKRLVCEKNIKTYGEAIATRRGIVGQKLRLWLQEKKSHFDSLILKVEMLLEGNFVKNKFVG